MGDSGFYKDYSASALTSAENITNAQQNLIDLGMDLGPSGADGDWGGRSQAAAAKWQEINGYEVTGDITTRQFAALQMQAEHPSMFHRQQLKPFYENFDQSLANDLDPARKALLMQAASHLGVQEIGDNTGPAVEQYLASDGRMSTGVAWCAAFGSWGMDQIENHAGIPNNSYMEANMRVHELHEHIQENSPNAIKSLKDYEPQTGDMLLAISPDGTGHYSMVVESYPTEGGTTAMLTIDGNAGDAVSVSVRLAYTDPNSGISAAVEMNPEDPLDQTIHPEIKMVAVDISELPNYDALNAGFNRKADFVPTPSADPNFKPDLEQLAALQENIQLYRDAKAPTLPELKPLDFNNGVQMSATTAFNLAPGG